MLPDCRARHFAEVHERGPAVANQEGGRAHVGRPGAGRHREPEPKRGDPQGHVPPIAVRDRDQARERRAQGLGQLTARAASPAGRVLCDPCQALPAAPVRVVPEQHPSAEEHLRVREGNRRGVSLAA